MTNTDITFPIYQFNLFHKVISTWLTLDILIVLEKKKLDYFIVYS